MPYATVRSAEDARAGKEGHRIYYRLFPEEAAAAAEDGGAHADRPRVLLLMGMGGTHSYWRPQVEHLAQRCRVCAVDNRGTGYSAAPAGELRWTTGRMARDALAVLTELGWHQGVHVIGISMGGMIAQELALADPERVASLSLLATYASAVGALPAFGAMADLAISTGMLGSSAKDRGMAALRLTFPEEWLRALRASPLHGGKVVDNFSFIKKYSYQMMVDVPKEFGPSGRAPGPPPVRTMVKQLTAVTTHRVSWARCERLRKRGIPIAIITGDRDILVRPVNSHILSELMEAKVHVLAGLGHGLIHQEPAAVNEVLDLVIEEGERGMRDGGAASSVPESPPRSRM